MEPATSIIVVDDDDFFRDRLTRALERRDHEIFQAKGFDEAVVLIRKERPKMAIFDLKMPGKNGLELVEESLNIDPDLVILVLTGYGSIATATEAIRLGAKSYLAKPADVNEILNALDENEKLTGEQYDLQTPTLARMEWEHIQRVLHECNSNISLAAKQLGLHRRTLQRKLNKGAPD